MRGRSARGRGALVTLSATALVLLSCLLPSAGLAAYPGDNGRIAYVGHVPAATYTDIFTLFPDGSGLQQLTDTEVSEGQPSWSASGRRLAYVRGAPVTRGEQVFMMNASGANQRQVTHEYGIHRSPSFSPSGRRIVYEKDNLPMADADTPRRVSIFTIRTDGTARRRLVRDYAASPEYSPDGKRIVFAGSPKRREGGIWTIRPDGSHLRRLTYPGGRGNYDQAPAWSPDGKHIVFLRCDRGSIHGCEGHVYVMRAYGANKHSILRVYGDDSPAFSPNGRRIALTRWNDETCSDIYTVTPWGTRPRTVTHNCDTPDAFAGRPSWQPVPSG